MITKKAAVGFILLAVIVFPLAFFDHQHMVTTKIPENNTVSIHQEAINSLLAIRPTQLTVKKPLLDFGDQTPLAMTGAIELFALFCYIALKWVEPKINRWEKRDRERVAEEREID